MKCEKCDKELAGGAVICRGCGYNNALQGIGNWRQRQARSNPLAQSGQTQDATLIQFPVSTGNGAAKTAALSDPGQPDWRSQVKEKVREARTRRGQEEAANGARSSNGSSSTITNPFVQAAVSRIRRAVPAPPPRGVAHTSQATARVIDYHEDPRPMAAQRPVAPEPQRVPEFVPRPEVVGKQVEIPVAAAPQVIPPAEPMPEREPAVIVARYAEPAPPPVEQRPAEPVIEVVQAPAPAVAATAVIDVPTPNPPYVPKRHVVRETQHAVASLPFEEIAEPVEEKRVFATEDVNDHYTVRTGSLPWWEPSKTPASIHRRILAGGIDLEIAALSFVPFFLGFAVLDPALNVRTLLMMAGSAIGLIFTYQFLMLLVAGRTCGMAMLKLDLTDVRGDCMALKRGRVFARAVGATLGVLLAPVNLALVLSSSHRQSLADRFSGSIVVKQ